MDNTRPQREREREREREEQLEKGSAVDGGLQVQLEEDGGSSSRQSWMELSGLWPASGKP